MKLIEVVDKIAVMHWLVVNDDVEEATRQLVQAHPFVVAVSPLPITGVDELLSYLTVEQAEQLEKEHDPDE
jgi:hypothetical protein